MRELRNVIERTVAFADAQVIDAVDLLFDRGPLAASVPSVLTHDCSTEHSEGTVSGLTLQWWTASPLHSTPHMSNDDDDQENVDQELAASVLSYFRKHPEAADSVEGIARWRLLEQTTVREVSATARALRIPRTTT